MKDYCYLIRDLGYLYKENMINPRTVCQIEKHLEECEECRAYYAELNESWASNQQEENCEPALNGMDLGTRDHQVLSSIRSRIHRKYVKKSMMGFLLGALVILCGFAWMTRPIYLPEDQAIEKIVKEGGENQIIFSPKVSNFIIEQTELPEDLAKEVKKSDPSGTACTISTWTTYWHRLFYQNHASSWSVEDGTPVLYAGRGSSGNTWLLNAPEPEHNGETVSFMELPRLVLAPWCIFALLTGIISGLLAWLIQRSPFHQYLLYISLAAVSFCLSALIMTGGNFASWNLGMDMVYILAGTLLIDILLLYGIRWLKQHSSLYSHQKVQENDLT